MEFVIIEGEAWDVSTAEQCDEIAKRLYNSHARSAVVFAGDPDGDHVKTGRVLWAAVPGDTGDAEWDGP
jgi:hypothetical protein